MPLFVMAKELPYFRFTSQEWQNGDIGLESYELKGLFIDICAYYWIKDCSITLAMLEKRFRDAKELIKELIYLEILKHEVDEDTISIFFLNEQFDLLSEKRKKRQEAGKIGGLQKASNAKAMLEQNPSYKDKDKDKEEDKDNNKDKDNTVSAKPKKFDFKKEFLNLGVEEKYLDAWMLVRKAKRAVNTEIAFNALVKEMKECELSVSKCVKIAAENSWAGFNYEWYLKRKNNTSQHNNNNGREEEYLTTAERIKRGDFAG